jgi:phosphoribosylglycinamide formyltransferase-1
LLTPEPSADPEAPRPIRLGILISGRGSNCLAIARAVAAGHLSGCEIGLVVSNIPGAQGIEAARSLGIPVVTLEGRGREQRDHEEAISALLRKFRIDLICLAGYRRVLSAGFVRQWKGRVVNLHASLLPAFPGHGAARQALDYGAQVTGCTVYFVDEQVDGGVIILQRIIDIQETDTEQSLAEALLPLQHIAYTEAIRRIVSNDFEIRGRRYVRRDLPYPEPAWEPAGLPEEESFNPSHGAETLQRPAGVGVR